MRALGQRSTLMAFKGRPSSFRQNDRDERVRIHSEPVPTRRYSRPTFVCLPVGICFEANVVAVLAVCCGRCHQHG